MPTISQEIRCKIIPQRIIFPRDKRSLKDGEFGVISAEVLYDKPIEGEVKESSYGGLSISGNFEDLKLGITYGFSGTYKRYRDDHTYELNYVLEDLNFEDKNDQDTFLKRVLTITQYENIKNRFENPFEIIRDEDVKLLSTVKGIGEATAIKICQKYRNLSEFGELYVKLSKYKLTDNFVQKLIDKYDDTEKILDIIQRNPYQLIEDIDGIGWIVADKIAMQNKLPKDSIKRIRGFILYKLEELGANGVSWIKTVELIKMITEEIKVALKEPKIKALKSLKNSGLIELLDNNKRIALSKYYNLEKKIAMELKRLKNAKSEIEVLSNRKLILEIESEQGWEYNLEQSNFIEKCLSENVVLLTGSAGSGKSTTSNIVLKLLSQSDNPVIGCSLAGKAVENLRQYTNQDCRTIHKLLEWRGGSGFIFNRNEQLPVGTYLLDELSMVGGSLFYAFLQAIPNGSKIIFLADHKQLEAIGNCNILKDIMESKYITHVNLTEIHRQAQKSGIISDCALINNGELIFDNNFKGELTRGELNDMHYSVHINKSNMDLKVISTFMDLYKESSLEDIQIITPLKKKGSLCTYALNKSIQSRINPEDENKKETSIKYKKFPYTLRVGDKVMINKNSAVRSADKDLAVDIFNGNCGILIDIEDDDNLIIDLYNMGKVVIEKKDIKIVELAYALTVHKCQGSGIDNIIFALDTSSVLMLRREMVYTAISRAKKSCYVITENRAFEKSIKTVGLSQKQTFLKEFLENY